MVGRGAVPAIDALAPRPRLPMNDPCLRSTDTLPHYHEREAGKMAGTAARPTEPERRVVDPPRYYVRNRVGGCFTLTPISHGSYFDE